MKEPVFSSERKWADDILYFVVVDFDAAIFEVVG
jgi:hypothetical protein